jgi:hypothetical protein
MKALLCWLLGHENEYKTVKKGPWTSCTYKCKRCGRQDGFESLSFSILVSEGSDKTQEGDQA